eukprot:3247439-Pyramimonas_sp.AAC.1
MGPVFGVRVLLGLVVEPTWSVLEASWAVWKPSEALSGPFGGCLGLPWASLEQSGHRLGVV